ncbi:hypothetical protein [Thiomicrospira sp.]|uniref:hypothetical protein n=1 Tax=Thiomicrospira sp. TaxID=935 RepID=UPI002F935E8B
MSFQLNLNDVFFDDRDFVQKKISHFPVEIQKELLKKYLQKPSRGDANLFLRCFVDDVSQKINIKPSLLKLNHDEDSLRIYANDRSDVCSRYVHANNNINVNEKIAYLSHYAKSYGISVNVNKASRGLVKRFCDPIWWLRKLRKSLTRNIETIYHQLNKVNRFKGIYASNWLTGQRRNQLFRHEQSVHFP